MSDRPRKTVLIVDDDRPTRHAMTKVVEQLGYRAAAADRASRAAAVIAGGKVDAILLDLQLPGPQGEHLLNYLRRNKLPTPPTIVVSGYVHKERIGTLLNLGVCGIIAKPFAAKRLMDELRRVLEGREKRHSLSCPQCRAAAQADDRFCRQCGNHLQSKRTCPGCRNPYDLEDQFCGNCGYRIAQTNAAASTGG